MTTDRTLPMVFKLTGQLDIARQAELDDIEAAASQSDVAIVDMTEVTFLDSTALNWLVRTKRALEKKNGQLRVVASAGVVTRLLSVTGLEGVIEVIAPQSEVEGLAAI